MSEIISTSNGTTISSNGQGTSLLDSVLGKWQTDYNSKDLFILVCKLVKADAITMDEAWELVLKILPKEKEYIPYQIGPYCPPIEPWTVPNTPAPNPVQPWYKGWEVYCSSGGTTTEVNKHIQK